MLQSANRPQSARHSLPQASPHTIAMHNICKATHTNSTCDQNQILIRCSCPNHWNLQPPLAAGWPRSGAGNSAPGDSHHHTRRFLHSSVAHSSGRGEVWLVIGLASPVTCVSCRGKVFKCTYMYADAYAHAYIVTYMHHTHRQQTYAKHASIFAQM